MAGALRSVHKPTTPAKFLTQSSWPGTVALDVKCVVPFVQDITKKERGVGGQDDSGEEDSSAQVRERWTFIQGLIFLLFVVCL